jgi:hypothetical protein
MDKIIDSCVDALAEKGPGKWRINFDGITTDPGFGESAGFDPRMMLETLRTMVRKRVHGKYNLLLDE